MSPAEEVGTVVSTGSGRATLTFIGNQIMYEIAYSGLSSSATAAHFHGPAAPGANNGVIIPLNNPSGTSGTISGTVSVSTTNLAYILAGQTYLNMHTLNNGGGEIRGQVYPYQFTANLNGASEFPVNNSTGSGTGTFSIAGGNLTYSVSYTNLSSAATAGHIHGPALPGANNGVIVPFTAPSGTSGTTAGTAAMPSPTAYYMLNGLTYANIHTLNFGGGEIRGQVMPKF